MSKEQIKKKVIVKKLIVKAELNFNKKVAVAKELCFWLGKWARSKIKKKVIVKAELNFGKEKFILKARARILYT